jgi:hypothetical protein
LWKGDRVTMTKRYQGKRNLRGQTPDSRSGMGLAWNSHRYYLQCDIALSLCWKLDIWRVIFSCGKHFTGEAGDQHRILLPLTKQKSVGVIQLPCGSDHDFCPTWSEYIKSLAETLLPADVTMQAMKFIAEAKQGQ